MKVRKTFMKKIIVAIAMLLVATLAISVSAATAADFGAETYYLGNPVKTAPVLDATFGANEYTVTYTLDKGIYLDAAGNVLTTPADASALTSAVKVGVAYDVENLYVAIESTLAANVASAEYAITSTIGTLPSFNEANAEAKKVAYKTADGKFVGELVFDLDNDDASAYGKTFTLAIRETTKNAEGATLNVADWNKIALTSGQEFEMNGADTLTHTFVLGSEATLGDKVTVEQEPVGVPGQTLPVVTEAPTTEAPTTAPETEAPTTDAPTTAPETEAPTTAPVTEAPTTEAPEEGGCGSSVAAMGIALVAALGTCAVVVSKKED